MSNVANLLIIFAVGMGLGAFFFYGLWWTICRGLGSKNPALWFFCSFIIRVAVITLGFYLIFQNRLENLLVALTGFWLARSLVSQYTRRTARLHDPKKREVGHAPES